MIHRLFCIQTELDVRLHILFTLALRGPLVLEFKLNVSYNSSANDVSERAEMLMPRRARSSDVK